MASILKVDDLRGNTSAGDITITSEGGSATQSLQQGLIKFWVNFDATSSNAVRDSLNASSITDSGSGTFQVVMTNPMVSNDYSYNGFAGNYCYVTSSTSYSPTTTGFNHYSVRYNTTTYTDASAHLSQAFGDLA